LPNCIMTGKHVVVLAVSLWHVWLPCAQPSDMLQVTGATWEAIHPAAVSLITMMSLFMFTE